MIDSKILEKELENIFDSADFLGREIIGRVRGELFFIDGLCDKELLERDVIAPLINDIAGVTFEDVKRIPCADKIEIADRQNCASVIAEGDMILALDGAENLYKISLRKLPHRSVSEPPTETVIKGPREGFTEEIKTNISMLRHRLKTPSLRVKKYQVGRFGNTTINVVYIDKIADKRVVDTICARVKDIDIDGAIGAQYIESHVSEHADSIFNMAGITEKPDIVTAKLLEGRVAIFLDGTPVVTTYPYIMFESFQDSYDYYIKNHRSSMLRILRILGAILAVLLPGLYVAFQEYHYHLLPLKFLISILNSVSGIPFTPPMEMLFVLILFEILYQASVRMPRYVGTALSIVGAIVLGETAVNAGLLSSPTVLIIAISAIGINCVPDLVDTFSMLRLMVLLVGSALGLFGIILFSIFIIAYLVSIDNFGAPYLAPYAPFISNDIKDGIIKDSELDMNTRPFSIPNVNKRRGNGRY